jgi:serine/threonine protein phosphatase PrpC
MLTDDEILEVAGRDDGDLDAICEELVTRANAAGGNDNTTVVMCRVEADETAEAAEPQPKKEPAPPVAGGAIELLEKAGGIEAFLERAARQR